MWQTILVPAVALEQLEQAFQCWLVLLTRQLLNAQLVSGFIIQRILRQAALEVGNFWQAGGLAQDCLLYTSDAADE